MKYWKRIDGQDNTLTVESYSHSLEIEGAIEITKVEFNEYLASLPIIEYEPELVRDYGKEIDELRAEIDKLKAK